MHLLQHGWQILFASTFCFSSHSFALARTTYDWCGVCNQTKRLKKKKHFWDNQGSFSFRLLSIKGANYSGGKLFTMSIKDANYSGGDNVASSDFLGRELVYLVLPQWVNPLNVKSLILLCSIYIEESIIQVLLLYWYIQFCRSGLILLMLRVLFLLIAFLLREKL